MVVHVQSNFHIKPKLVLVDLGFLVPNFECVGLKYQIPQCSLGGLGGGLGGICSFREFVFNVPRYGKSFNPFADTFCQ